MSGSDDFLRFQGTPGYITSGPLVDAVNCAIALERPLLIKGEPGTGKTLLARHVAQGLGMPMDSWHVKSTSKAGLSALPSQWKARRNCSLSAPALSQFASSEDVM